MVFRSVGMFFVGLFFLTQGLAKDLEFESAISPEFVAYQHILEYPGVLAAALENAGVQFRDIADTKIISASEVEFRSRTAEPLDHVTVHFQGKVAQKVLYQFSIFWQLAPLKGEVTGLAELDLGSLKQGTIRAKLKMENLPTSLALLLDQALKRYPPKPISDEQQRKLLTYLADAKTRETLDPAISSFANPILMDAYNRPSRRAIIVSRPGDALPVSDQVLLLLSIGIWLVAVPVTLVVYYILRKKFSTGLSRES